MSEICRYPPKPKSVGNLPTPQTNIVPRPIWQAVTVTQSSAFPPSCGDPHFRISSPIPPALKVEGYAVHSASARQEPLEKGANALQYVISCHNTHLIFSQTNENIWEIAFIFLWFSLRLLDENGQNGLDTTTEWGKNINFQIGKHSGKITYLVLFFKIEVVSSRNFASRAESEFTKCESEPSRVEHCELQVESSWE